MLGVLILVGQHLKELKDPIMESVLLETENMLARGRMDLPLSLCFAALREDDLLLLLLLYRGLDPNEADNNGRSALHIAASKGTENCVLLLLDYGADPNRKDSEGSVPLWEAMLGGHKEIAKLLKEHGANVCLGDVGNFACTAVERNNMNLLKEIVQFGGDVTQPRGNGITALHVAVCEDNIEIVKFLLEHGANVNKKDVYGCSPRDLVDRQGREEIKVIFQEQHGVRYLSKFTSKPTIRPVPQEGSFPNTYGSWGQSRLRRKRDIFRNSLFGMMSAMYSDEKYLLCLVRHSTGVTNNEVSPARVIISCPEIGEICGIYVLLPKTFQKLLEIGSKKFGFWPTKVLLNENKAKIEDIEVIRDGDHLIFSSAKTEEIVEHLVSRYNVS